MGAAGRAPRRPDRRAAKPRLVPPNRLLHLLRHELRSAGDPARAKAMQRYMRSAMPFHGVATPEARRMESWIFADAEFPSAEDWCSTVLYLWRNARFREERYAAIDLTGLRAAREFQTVAAMPMYEEMIVTGAWWDYVDLLATHRVGTILRRSPRPMARRMRAWSRSPNLWKRRTAILSQVGSKSSTDSGLLLDCIEPSIGSKEFFLRKAIGWALRQHARVDPDAVRAFVAQNEARLSPLSRREALRRLPR